MNTRIASCIKRTDISMPKSSPATLVNLVMSVQAFSIARTQSMIEVQKQTLIQKSKDLMEERKKSMIIKLQNNISITSYSCFYLLQHCNLNFIFHIKTLYLKNPPNYSIENYFVFG